MESPLEAETAEIRRPSATAAASMDSHKAEIAGSRLFIQRTNEPRTATASHATDAGQEGVKEEIARKAAETEKDRRYDITESKHL